MIQHITLYRLPVRPRAGRATRASVPSLLVQFEACPSGGCRARMRPIHTSNAPRLGHPLVFPPRCRRTGRDLSNVKRHVPRLSRIERDAPEPFELLDGAIHARFHVVHVQLHHLDARAQSAVAHPRPSPQPGCRQPPWPAVILRPLVIELRVRGPCTEREQRRDRCACRTPDRADHRCLSAYATWQILARIVPIRRRNRTTVGERHGQLLPDRFARRKRISPMACRPPGLRTRLRQRRERGRSTWSWSLRSRDQSLRWCSFWPAATGLDQLVLTAGRSIDARSKPSDSSLEEYPTRRRRRRISAQLGGLDCEARHALAAIPRWRPRLGMADPQRVTDLPPALRRPPLMPSSAVDGILRPDQ